MRAGSPPDLMVAPGANAAGRRSRRLGTPSRGSDAAPAGWSGPIAPVNLGNGITYVTYWLLTPR
jgi:hypothetical protein